MGFNEKDIKAWTDRTEAALNAHAAIAGTILLIFFKLIGRHWRPVVLFLVLLTVVELIVREIFGM